MVLTALSPADIPFVFECLGELRGGAEYPVEALRAYVDGSKLVQAGATSILIAIDDERPVGMLTANRYAMPRYLGYGIELEEVVIHPRFQGHGYGAAMLAAFLERVSGDPELRRVTVRTDDIERAGRLYARHFEATSAVVYSRGMHRI